VGALKHLTLEDAEPELDLVERAELLPASAWADAGPLVAWSNHAQNRSLFRG
jgi:hypothetical protein